MSGSILTHKQFVIDDHKISFAAGYKRGMPVVVFGVSTLSDIVPLLTLEKDYPDPQAACLYVDQLTEKAARKLLDYYRREHSGVVTLVDAVFTGPARTDYGLRHKRR
ncbi:hypothetical protein [Atlantibacter hermannii]|uniref:hypothetical protein n=1 Tax=Atlantibacter hermannii TaxID=565 RepID=UPI00289EE128|nr:hypothetical protein [Atlantibacter hermannii]